MRNIYLLLVLAVVALVPGGAFAASTICSGDTCTIDKVGPFMEGISAECGNAGTCSLADIETVFANVGNWILGIIGALVFLMYVVGGFYFLLSGLPGMEKFREKGKTALKQSTVGLLIVFVAFAALQTLNSVLRYGSLPDTEGYVSCGPGDLNDGAPCAENSTCVDGACKTACQQGNPGTLSEDSLTYTFSECAELTTASSKYGSGNDVYLDSCLIQTGLCPNEDQGYTCCEYVVNVE